MGEVKLFPMLLRRMKNPLFCPIAGGSQQGSGLALWNCPVRSHREVNSSVVLRGRAIV